MDFKLSVVETPPQHWNTFVHKKAADGGVLQTTEWANFQRLRGNNTFFVSVLQNESIKLQCLIIENTIPKLGWKKYIAPRGPVFSSQEAFDFFLIEISQWLVQQNAVSLTLEPNTDDKGIAEQLIEFGYKEIFAIQPKNTLIIPLNSDYETIIAKAHSKTRYNIRLAAKKGVTISEITKPNKKDIAEFHTLLAGTSNKQSFGIYPKSYFEKMATSFEGTDMMRIFFAEYEGKRIAAAQMIFDKPWVYYLHGGSNYVFRKLMAPHLLHARIIERAIEEGYDYYDLWGVQGEESSTKDASWAGITRFKRGFMPNKEITTFPGTYEIIVNKWKNSMYKSLIMARKVFRF